MDHMLFRASCPFSRIQYSRWSALSAVCWLAILILMGSNPPAAAEEKKTNVYWYRLEIQTGDSTYQCLGSSPLEEKEFAAQMNGAAFIALDDAAYVDQEGKVKRWQEWDSKTQPRLYINPRYVIFFNPLKSDPRKPSEKNPARVTGAR